MAKYITGFLIAFGIISICQVPIAGSGGYVITKLAANITVNTPLTITVDNNGGFNDDGYLWIGDECVHYTSRPGTDQFVVDLRGQQGTSAANHNAGVNVYSPTANVIAYAAGYDVIKTMSQASGWSVIILPFNFLTITVPHLLAFNVGLMGGGIFDMFLGLVWMAALAGVTITMAIQMAWSATNLLSRLIP